MGSTARHPVTDRYRAMMRALPPGLMVSLLACAPCAAQADSAFKVDGEGSVARFVHVRGSRTLELGRFERAHGLIRYDEHGPGGSVDLAFLAHSANTGSGLLNRLLTSPLFLNAQRFPELSFQSQTVRFEQGRPVSIEGQLTIRDVTRTVQLTIKTFTLVREGEAGQTVLNSLSTTHIHRSDFGLGAYVPLIGDEIQLEIRVRGVYP